MAELNQEIVTKLVDLLISLSNSGNEQQSSNIAINIINISNANPMEYVEAQKIFRNQHGGSKISKKRYARLSTKRKSRNNKKKTHKKRY